MFRLVVRVVSANTNARLLRIDVCLELVLRRRGSLSLTSEASDKDWMADLAVRVADVNIPLR